MIKGDVPHAEYAELQLNVLKNRNGETGAVKFRFYPGRAEFVETGRGELPSDHEKVVA